MDFGGILTIMTMVPYYLSLMPRHTQTQLTNNRATTFFEIILGLTPICDGDKWRAMRQSNKIATHFDMRWQTISSGEVWLDRDILRQQHAVRIQVMIQQKPRLTWTTYLSSCLADRYRLRHAVTNGAPSRSEGHCCRTCALHLLDQGTIAVGYLRSSSHIRGSLP